MFNGLIAVQVCKRMGILGLAPTSCQAVGCGDGVCTLAACPFHQCRASKTSPFWDTGPLRQSVLPSTWVVVAPLGSAGVTHPRAVRLFCLLEVGGSAGLPKGPLFLLSFGRRAAAAWAVSVCTHHCHVCQRLRGVGSGNPPPNVNVFVWRPVPVCSAEWPGRRVRAAPPPAFRPVSSRTC